MLDTLIVALGEWRRTYNLEGVSDNAGGHQLLSVVAAVHHERVGETLNDGALSLAESLGGIATGGVGDVDGGANLDVVARDIKLAGPILANFASARAFGRWCSEPRS